MSWSHNVTLLNKVGNHNVRSWYAARAAQQGYEVTTESYKVSPNGEPIDVSWGGPALPEGEISPMAYWGSSYATSTETAYVFYTGRAKAAGNVYNNQRIVKVCISYSHTLRSSPRSARPRHRRDQAGTQAPKLLSDSRIT